MTHRMMTGQKRHGRIQLASLARHSKHQTSRLVHECARCVCAAAMAEVFLRNRRVDERRAQHGYVPLSSGEVEYLKRQDENAFRKQRLLQVRDHERRVAQEVTRRYRENLRRLQGQRLRLTQREHHSQREILLTELHRKYQYSLQNVGAAQKNAREKLVELVNQAHVEKDKWAFNAQAEKLRYVDATDMVKEEEMQRLARRREIERNLVRLKEMSNKQRNQAASRARRELEWELKMEQEREEAALLRRNQAEMEVFSFPRTNSKDVTSYHFTRTHCVAAPGSTQEKSDKPRTEVKVIRHNSLRQEANAIDAAATYRQEMDEKSEANRTKREEETRIAASRGNDAVQRVESDRKGAEAMRLLAAMDQDERVRRAGNVPVHEDNEDPVTRAELAEDEFAALFGIHDDELNHSWGRSVEEDATGAAERVLATRQVGLDDSVDSEADSFIRFPSQGRDGGPVHPHDGVSAGSPVEGDGDLSIQQKFDRMKALLEKVGTSDRRAPGKDGDGDYQREVQPRDVFEGREGNTPSSKRGGLDEDRNGSVQSENPAKQDDQDFFKEDALTPNEPLKPSFDDPGRGQGPHSPPQSSAGSTKGSMKVPGVERSDRRTGRHQDTRDAGFQDQFTDKQASTDHFKPHERHSAKYEQGPSSSYEEEDSGHRLSDAQVHEHVSEDDFEQARELNHAPPPPDSDHGYNRSEYSESESDAQSNGDRASLGGLERRLQEMLSSFGQTERFVKTPAHHRTSSKRPSRSMGRMGEANASDLESNISAPSDSHYESERESSVMTRSQLGMPMYTSGSAHSSPDDLSAPTGNRSSTRGLNEPDRSSDASEAVAEGQVHPKQETHQELSSSSHNSLSSSRGQNLQSQLTEESLRRFDSQRQAHQDRRRVGRSGQNTQTRLQSDNVHGGSAQRCPSEIDGRESHLQPPLAIRVRGLPQQNDDEASELGGSGAMVHGLPAFTVDDTSDSGSSTPVLEEDPNRLGFSYVQPMPQAVRQKGSRSTRVHEQSRQHHGAKDSRRQPQRQPSDAAPTPEQRRLSELEAVEGVHDDRSEVSDLSHSQQVPGALRFTESAASRFSASGGLFHGLPAFTVDDTSDSGSSTPVLEEDPDRLGLSYVQQMQQTIIRSRDTRSSPAREQSRRVHGVDKSRRSVDQARMQPNDTAATPQQRRLSELEAVQGMRDGPEQTLGASQLTEGAMSELGASGALFHGLPAFTVDDTSESGSSVALLEEDLDRLGLSYIQQMQQAIRSSNNHASSSRGQNRQVRDGDKSRRSTQTRSQPSNEAAIPQQRRLSELEALEHATQPLGMSQLTEGGASQFSASDGLFQGLPAFTVDGSSDSGSSTPLLEEDLDRLGLSYIQHMQQVLGSKDRRSSSLGEHDRRPHGMGQSRRSLSRTRTRPNDAASFTEQRSLSELEAVGGVQDDRSEASDPTYARQGLGASRFTESAASRFSASGGLFHGLPAYTVDDTSDSGSSTPVLEEDPDRLGFSYVQQMPQAARSTPAHGKNRQRRATYSLRQSIPQARPNEATDFPEQRRLSELEAVQGVDDRSEASDVSQAHQALGVSQLTEGAASRLSASGALFHGLPAFTVDDSSDSGSSTPLLEEDLTNYFGLSYFQQMEQRVLRAGDSSSSSIRQFSLPLTGSFSSADDSFSDVASRDSMLNKLVPMFPGGQRRIEQGHAEKVRSHQPSLDSVGGSRAAVETSLDEQADTESAHEEAKRMHESSISLASASHAHGPAQPSQQHEPAVQRDLDELAESGCTQGGDADSSFISDTSSDMSAYLYLARMRQISEPRGVPPRSTTARSASAKSASSSTRSGPGGIVRQRMSSASASQGRRESVESSSSSTPSIDARFQYLVTMTDTAGKALPLHLNLPPRALSHPDMTIPPSPLPFGSDSGEQSGSQQKESVKNESLLSSASSEQDARARLGMSTNPIMFSFPPPPYGAADMSVPPPSMARSFQGSAHSDREDASVKSSSKSQREESEGTMSPPRQFSLGELSERLGNVLPAPFEMFDMSQPPAPLWDQSSTSSRLSAAYSMRQSRVVSSESHSPPSVDDMSVVSETVNDEEKPQTLKRSGGEALFVGFGEEEEEKENDQEEGSLADAFRRRHPEFQRRAQSNQELIEGRRQQQEARQETAQPAAERQEEQTSERKQSARSRVSLPDGSSSSPMPRPNLLDRLASGERAKMSAQEMRERTRRLYQQLPEVVERKRQEEVLAKRRQRLNELREREKERRQQQRQRKSQSQGRPSLG